MVEWHIDLHGLCNNENILLEEQQWWYLTHSCGGDKGVKTLGQSFCQKVNVIAQLQFELAYYNSAVQWCNHYNSRTYLSILQKIRYHSNIALYRNKPFFLTIGRVSLIYGLLHFSLYIYLYRVISIYIWLQKLFRESGTNYLQFRLSGSSGYRIYSYKNYFEIIFVTILLDLVLSTFCTCSNLQCFFSFDQSIAYLFIFFKYFDKFGLFFFFPICICYFPQVRDLLYIFIFELLAGFFPYRKCFIQ